MTTVKVNRKAAARVESGHPWIFSDDVVHRGDARGGEAVRVDDPTGRLLGTAHYSSSSRICLRMLASRQAGIDRDFFLERLRLAAEHRTRVVHSTDACRLVHGEGDRLPALVVDRYGEYFTVQTLNQGMDASRDWIVSCLEELFSPKGIMLRNDSPVRKHEQLPLERSVAAGNIPERVEIGLNGLRFAADLRGGQKTGVYLDQRENYAAAAAYGRGKALDCFTSCGGFALHLAARCKSVEAVDSSAPALELAEHNCRLNEISNLSFRRADVFELLAGYASGGRRFDMVVLDPPAFAKSRSVVSEALRGYREINYRAFSLLEPGGILVSCSCSHHVSEAMLLAAVAAAACDADKTVRVLERRTQSRDHPILLTVPETHYLKCLFLEVL